MKLTDKLNGLDNWAAGITSSDQPHATDEWKERALATVERNRKLLFALLEEFGDIELPSIYEAANGVGPLDPVEVQAVRWQWGHHIGLSRREKATWDLLTELDSSGLDDFESTHPAQVKAIKRWRHESGFSDRIDILLDR
jgi:hypothetical protein